jgi:hypothetical protein
MKFGIVSSAQVGCDGLAKAVAFLRPLLPSP